MNFMHVLFLIWYGNHLRLGKVHISAELHLNCIIKSPTFFSQKHAKQFNDSNSSNPLLVYPQFLSPAILLEIKYNYMLVIWEICGYTNMITNYSIIKFVICLLKADFMT